jgi:hypothetical protein
MNDVGSLGPVKSGLKAGAFHLKGKIATYPKVSRRPVAQYWTDKQRRGFFAKLRSGEIDVPYRRGISNNSERLGQSWAVQGRDGGLTQVIGNDSSYGQLVQDRSLQSLYHKTTGWKTTDDVTEQEARAVTEGVKRAIDRALARAR